MKNTTSSGTGLSVLNRSNLLAFWLGTTARYTLLALFSLLVNALLSRSMTGTYVDTARFLLLLPFAAALTGGARIRHASLGGGLKLLLHALCVLGGFYLCVYLPYQLTTHPSGQQILMILLLVLTIYGIAAAVYAILHRSSRQKTADETPYVSQFGGRR